MSAAAGAPGVLGKAPSAPTRSAAGAATRRTTAALWLLYLAGAAHWTLFFDPPRTPFDGPSFTVEDWPKEYRYYSTLQQATREGRLPLYLSRPIHTRKFLALPEVSWSPQVLLLRWLPIGTFVVVNTLLLYSAGFAGCLLLRRRYALGLLPFALLVLLFAFNGHLVAHLSVGHSMWAGLFLLPFVFLPVLEIVENDARPATDVALAVALFAVLLQGAFHVFVWCVMFLLLLAAFERRVAAPVLKALAWAAALSACRLAPAFFLVARKEQAFLSGFPTALDLWSALVTIRGPDAPMRGRSFGVLEWWEYDTYVGVPALAWVLYFGLRPATAHAPRRALYGPIAVMALLSVGDLYAPFNALPIPLLSAERVSSRFLVLPLLWLAILAALAMPRAAASRRTTIERWAAAAALALSVAGFAAHSSLWRVPRLEGERPQRHRSLAVAIGEPAAGAGREHAYLATVAASFATSSTALAAAGWRLRRRFRPPPAAA
jgi:hypothetical protein